MVLYSYKEEMEVHLIQSRKSILEFLWCARIIDQGPSRG